jgi:hypothetical protein
MLSRKNRRWTSPGTQNGTTPQTCPKTYDQESGSTEMVAVSPRRKQKGA